MPQVETQKDRSLRRRTQPSPSTPPGFAPPAKAPSEATLRTTELPTTATTEVTAASQLHPTPDDRVEQTSMQATAAAAAAAASQATTAAGEAGTFSSDAGSAQQSASSSEQTAQQAAGAHPATRKSIIDATFGLAVRQRTKVTTGVQADKLRESRSFQVCTCPPGCTSRVAGTCACSGPALQFWTAQRLLQIDHV